MSAEGVHFSAMLDLLRLAQSQQRHAAELARATGEHFNIFKILRVGHLEVTTHSPMLAQLLNPQGVHGQGPTFLRLFLDCFNISGFDAESATVKMEHHIGALTEDSGGRIDILVQDSRGGVILIENKIYAADQPNQMRRNRNYDARAHLFYLTLDGRDPSNLQAVPGLRCISYASDVLNWLKECRKEAACVPTVRETLSQYIHLLQELTDQNTSTRMNQELTLAVLQTKDSYAAYRALCHAQQEIRKMVLTGLNEDLGELAKSMNLELFQPLHGDGRRYDGWFFTSSALAAQSLRIGCQFDSKDYQNFFFGFNRIVPNQNSALIQCLQEQFNSEFGMMKPTAAYAAHSWWEQHRYWTDATFESIRFGNFAEELKKLIERVVKVFQLACDAHLSPSNL